MADGARTARGVDAASMSTISADRGASSRSCGARRSATTGSRSQRTSVMTHIAWVPPEWLDAAERTLEGLAERHPSRTVILVPTPGRAGRDRRASSRCARSRSATAPSSSEVIELTLRGDRSRAPASIVLPLAISDLPVFLRWRGEPPFGETQWEQLVDVADRVIVDSSEWEELRYHELADVVRADRRLRHRVGAHRRLADRAGGALAGDRDAGDRDPRPAGRGGAAARLARVAARPRAARRRAGRRARRAPRRRGGRAPARGRPNAERPAQRRARPARARPDLRAGGFRAGRATLTRGWSGQLVSAGGSAWARPRWA